MNTVLSDPTSHSGEYVGFAHATRVIVLLQVLLKSALSKIKENNLRSACLNYYYAVLVRKSLVDIIGTVRPDG